MIHRKALILYATFLLRLLYSFLRPSDSQWMTLSTSYMRRNYCNRCGSLMIPQSGMMVSSARIIQLYFNHLFLLAVIASFQIFNISVLDLPLHLSTSSSSPLLLISIQRFLVTPLTSCGQPFSIAQPSFLQPDANSSLPLINF